MKAYQHVFIEPEDTHLAEEYYRIYHNHHGPSPSGAFVLIPYGEKPEEEFITVDEDSFSLFYTAFAEYVNDFSETDTWNPVKPEVWLQIRTQILRMITELEEERRTRLTQQIMTHCFLPFQENNYNKRWKEFFAQKQILLDFCRAFLWYFDEYKHFTYHDNDRILNFVGW